MTSPSDADWLLEQLRPGRSLTLTELLTRSFRERGCGLTVHSRAADLRRRGFNIEHLTIAGAERGRRHAYRLIQGEQPHDSAV